MGGVLLLPKVPSLQPFVLFQNNALSPQPAVAPHLKDAHEGEEDELQACCIEGSISKVYLFPEKPVFHFCSHMGAEQSLAVSASPPAQCRMRAVTLMKDQVNGFFINADIEHYIAWQAPLKFSCLCFKVKSCRCILRNKAASY